MNLDEGVHIPTEKKKKFQDLIQEMFPDFFQQSYGYAVPKLAMSLLGTVSLSLSGSSVGNNIIIINSNTIDVQQITEELNVTSAGTGGSEYIQFSNKFTFADEDYYCNGDEYGLRDESESSSAYYAESLPVGSSYQIDVEFSSTSPSLTVGRPELYEIVLGENGFDYISVKELRSGDIVELSLDGYFDGVRSRVRTQTNMLGSLSSVYVKEYIDESNNLVISINIDSQTFISEPFSLGQGTYRNISWSLIQNDSSRDALQSERVVYLPLGGPC